MSQIITKFIADNAVTDVKMRLTSGGWFRSRNNANSADINILRTNASDQIEFAFLPYYSGSQLATQSYADSAGKLKDSVVAVSLANILLDGSVTTIDGVSLSNGDRVLVAGQTSQPDNGIYIVSSTPWVRASDAATAAQLIRGLAVVSLDGGTAYGDTLWSLQASIVTLGTDNVVFKEVGGAATAFANRTLNNLTSPTAINQDLLPASAESANIGSPSLAWDSMFADAYVVENAAMTGTIGQLTNDGSDNLQLQSTNALIMNGGNGASMTALTGGAQVAANAGSVTLLATGVGNNVVLNPTPGDGGFIDASSSLISNVLNPVSAQDAATKYYVDNLAQGLSWKQVARSATTAALPSYTATATVLTASANGALPAQDGVTLVVNDRLLVKDEGTSPNNGIYAVTAVGDGSNPFILTRTSDANTASELTWATIEIGNDSATQAGYIYRESADITTLGTDNVAFAEVSEGIAASFRNGLTKTGNIVDVAPGDASLVSTPGSLVVQEDAAGAIVTGGSGIKVQLESSNPSLHIVSNTLGVKFNPSGAITSGSTGIAVGVDGSTTKVNGSNQVEALAPNFVSATLSGTDITNQYYDLSVVAAQLSVTLVVSGVTQTYGVDYTVNATGGVGGNTRISFAGDLATGGSAALVSGDVLNVNFEYLQ